MQGFRGPVYVAELDDRMYAAGNASACIAAGSCMPLGGHSVWAALPPVPPAGDAKSTTLVLAGVDSTAFFHAQAKVRRLLQVPQQLPADLPAQVAIGEPPASGEATGAIQGLCKGAVPRPWVHA